MRIQSWDSGSRIFFTLDPGSKMEKFGFWIRDKHPGPPTLVINIDVALLNLNLKGKKCSVAVNLPNRICSDRAF